ncbi:MAG: hypothetical protein SGI92_18965 [Bryobacteraceae bacterium]|nr:hypothetical protein [Bryobacteraceae bacterium]
MESPAAILSQLSHVLLRLHKVLLESERSIYERDVAKIESPGQFLGLLMEDPWFAYLRELSGLVVQIDQKIDDKKNPVRPEDVELFLQRARALLVPSEFGQGFEKRYFEALQRDPDVVMSHAAATRAINSLPAS